MLLNVSQRKFQILVIQGEKSMSRGIYNIGMMTCRRRRIQANIFQHNTNKVELDLAHFDDDLKTSEMK